MGYIDKEQKKEYARQWVAKRREKYFRDKVCVKCSSSDNLELDHINPEEKVSNSIWSWSEKRQQEEIAKCQILCHNCHLKKTKKWYEDKRNHGTNTMYNRWSCRCDSCKEAHKKYRAMYR